MAINAQKGDMEESITVRKADNTTTTTENDITIDKETLTDSILSEKYEIIILVGHIHIQIKNIE